MIKKVQITQQDQKLQLIKEANFKLGGLTTEINMLFDGITASLDISEEWTDLRITTKRLTCLFDIRLHYDLDLSHVDTLVEFIRNTLESSVDCD